MKKVTFILYIFSIIILGIIGIWIGVYAYKINSIGKLELPVLEGMENRDLEYELSLLANENEDIISPNAVLIIKTYYKDCGHELKTFMQIDRKYVNMSKEEFEKAFFKDDNINMKLENFSSKEITIKKEIEGNCDKHYILRENNGKIVVYKIDKENKEILYKETDIIVSYLTETDINDLKKGIYVVGDGELNSKLEDYM